MQLHVQELELLILWHFFCQLKPHQLGREGSKLIVYKLASFVTRSLEDNQKIVYKAKHFYDRQPLLPFTSSHSNLVKRSVAAAAPKNALHRSCHHCYSKAFPIQSKINPTTVKIL